MVTTQSPLISSQAASQGEELKLRLSGLEEMCVATVARLFVRFSIKRLICCPCLVLIAQWPQDACALGQLYVRLWGGVPWKVSSGHMVHVPFMAATHVRGSAP